MRKPEVVHGDAASFETYSENEVAEDLVGSFVLTAPAAPPMGANQMFNTTPPIDELSQRGGQLYLLPKKGSAADAKRGVRLPAATSMFALPVGSQVFLRCPVDQRDVSHCAMGRISAIDGARCVVDFNGQGSLSCSMNGLELASPPEVSRDDAYQISIRPGNEGLTLSTRAVLAGRAAVHDGTGANASEGNSQLGRSFVASVTGTAEGRDLVGRISIDAEPTSAVTMLTSQLTSDGDLHVVLSSGCGKCQISLEEAGIDDEAKMRVGLLRSWLLEQLHQAEAELARLLEQKRRYEKQQKRLNKEPLE
eukprot:3136506-Prymnesium_polylepis.1